MTDLGWGSGPWGFMDWGGGFSPAVPGGNIPNSPSFDIYCVGPGGPMSIIQGYLEVTTTPGGDFTTDIPSGDLIMSSGDGSEAELYINKNVDGVFSLEIVYKATELPPDFSSVATNHVFFGVVDTAGPAAGLFISQAGFAYSGTSTSAIQPLPGSQDFISENEYWVVRLVVSTITNATFIYASKLSDLIAGQELVLRYILPLVPYSSCPQDTTTGTYVKVKGTLAAPSQFYLDSICLSSSAIIPNVPPVADPGSDQAVPTCEIIRLDGTHSFDPEGKPLTYKWRLIDAPVGSMFDYSGSDGHTVPLSPATGFTNLFHSAAFSGPNAIPVSVGDVLLVQAKVYNIVAIGTDVNGPYVQISDYLLPDNLSGQNFKILIQHGISNATNPRPTFYPDVPGFFKFDLIVFDGALYSDPESVVINVVQSVLPRGIVPDVRFIWNYISDFWDLVDERERIETLWSGIAQIAASELYTLWQTEYSKSLRDVQRNFIRRWLHYDLLLREPFPEITKVRAIFRGIDSISVLNTGGTYSGDRIDITIPFATTVASVTLTGGNPLTPTAIATQLQAGLTAVDSRFTVTVVSVDSTHSLIRIFAPFGFTIASTSSTSLYTTGAQNGMLQGTGGILTNPNTYKVDISLLGIDIRENDVLIVQISDPAGNYNLAVRVNSIVDSASDTLRYQRITTKDAIPLTATSTWLAPGYAVSTQLDFYNGLVENGDIGVFEVVDTTANQIFFYQSTVQAAIAAVPNLVLLDTTAIGDFLAASNYTVSFWGVYRRKYLPIESLITDIPNLQRVIKEPSENEVLHRNLDFFLETFRGSTCLRFDPTIWVSSTPQIPVPRLWAEYTYLDNRPTIEANFGIPVEFTLDDLSQLPTSIDYLSAVQGIWYAYLNGPTMFNLRAGTQILLGLPFAEVAGTITEIRTDFSPTQGRILVQDSAPPNLVRAYQYPSVLPLETNPVTGQPYKVGDTVTGFAPLVSGAAVIDYVKDPKWFQGWMNQGSFFEVEKFHRFIVRVDSAAFTLPSLLFVRNFILKIKPTYTFPTFIVLATMPDAEVTVTDVLEEIGKLDVQDGAYFVSPGTVTAWDVPDTSPGFISGGIPTAYTGNLSSHYRQAYDTQTEDMVTGTFPTSPTPDGTVQWGFDRPLTGDQNMVAILREVWAGGVPTFDGVFRYDLPVLDDVGLIFGRKHFSSIPSTGFNVEDPITVVNPDTFNVLMLTIKGDPGLTSGAFRIQIFKNAVLTIDEPFTLTSPGTQNLFWSTFTAPAIGAVTVAANDVITAKIVPDGGGNRFPYIREVLVALTHGGPVFQFDTSLAAGTYVAHKAL